MKLLLLELEYMITHPRLWYRNLRIELKKADEAAKRAIERTVQRLTEGK